MTDPGKTRPLARPDNLKIELSGIPVSTSQWGNADLLNTLESSRQTTDRVVSAVVAAGSDQLYVGVRLLNTVGENRTPLMVFGFDPRVEMVSLEEDATGITGPLSKSEAIAAGYLLETAWIAKDLLEGQIDLIKAERNPYFEVLSDKFKGSLRFLPLGIITLLDHISRMAHYRNVRTHLAEEDIDENDPADLAFVLGGAAFVPLAEAFKRDNFGIGDNCQGVIGSLYANSRLFVPFAGIDNQPKSQEDDRLIGLGLTTGILLFRKIEEYYFKFGKLKSGEIDL